MHFALFVISFIGYVPYFFSSWDHKLLVAQNLYSENWDISPFHLNKILLHEIDQVLNVLHTYVYSFSLWYLLWHYKNSTKRSIIQSKQYKLVRNWLLIFASFLTIITINFTLAMASIWLYDDKSVFLNNASVALLFASIVYLGMNSVVLFFPHIMYGLPLKLSKSRLVKTIEISPRSFKNVDDGYIGKSQQPTDKKELQLFTDKYLKTIETSLNIFKKKYSYLNHDCKLIQIANDYNIPVHHLTYFLNEIEKISFSDWRNTLRIEHAIILMNNGETKDFTLESLSLKCGFASQNTFIRAFKKVNGITPSAYLKLNY
ncbi:AraC family transcriptional regulator [Maribacter arcticus]|nr:AraC family transcriptional regulator [Maribacter arcticus]MDA9089692.1 AraC family transcriptional regulator [Maribacter arcticus]